VQAEAVTRGVRVRASVVFAPEESNEAVFTFAYRRGQPAAGSMSVAALGSAIAPAACNDDHTNLLLCSIPP